MTVSDLTPLQLLGLFLAGSFLAYLLILGIRNLDSEWRANNAAGKLATIIGGLAMIGLMFYGLNTLRAPGDASACAASPSAASDDPLGIR